MLIFDLFIDKRASFGPVGKSVNIKRENLIFFRENLINEPFMKLI